jgi:DNA polymerase-1
MSADPTLLDVYTKNEVSIHHITSVAMFGESYTDDQKMRAKAVNFGIVYGRTAPSLAEEFNISIREADDYIRIWFARYPKAREFIESCRDAPNQMRNLITNFGRRKRWGVISFDNGRNMENEAANFPHQSSAHDVTLLAGIETQPHLRRIWDAEFVNEIHDALYFEIANDPNVFGPAIAYLQSVMQRIPKDWGLTRVPFLAEAKIGYRWGAKSAAKQAGITDEALLGEYMTGFTPTEEHREEAKILLVGAPKTS